VAKEKGSINALTKQSAVLKRYSILSPGPFSERTRSGKRPTFLFQKDGVLSLTWGQRFVSCKASRSTTVRVRSGSISHGKCSECPRRTNLGKKGLVLISFWHLLVERGVGKNSRQSLRKINHANEKDVGVKALDRPSPKLRNKWEGHFWGTKAPRDLLSCQEATPPRIRRMSAKGPKRRKKQ